MPTGWKRELEFREGRDFVWVFESDKYAPKEDFLKISGMMAIDKVQNCGKSKDEKGYTIGYYMEDREDLGIIEDVNRSKYKDEELMCISNKELAIKKATEKQEELSKKFYRKWKKGKELGLYGGN